MPGWFSNTYKRYLDPTNGYAFQRLFGGEERRRILINFLNSILFLEGDQTILEVTPDNPYNSPEFQGLPSSLLYIRCRDRTGNGYPVQLLTFFPSVYPEFVFHDLMAAAVQPDKLIDSRGREPIVLLGILGSSFLEGDAYVTNFYASEAMTYEHGPQDARVTLVELPKFAKSEQELSGITDKWVYFLKNASNLTSVPSAIYENAIKEAFEVIDKGSWDERELEGYEAAFDQLRQEEGRMLGHLEKGIELGEERTLKRVAIKMLQAGTKEDLILSVTGLSRTDLAAIKTDFQ